MTKIAIVGAGAIGGMIGAILGEAGADPLIVARGATKAALETRGLSFVEGDHRSLTHPRVTDTPADHGAQDLVVIAVKAHQIEAALPNILPLVGPETLVLTAINGVPWWFFQRHDGPRRDHVLRRVDPTGALSNAFDPERIVGCAVYLAAEVHAPYTVESAGPRRLVCGMPTGAIPDRLRAVAALFENAGLPMPLTDDIRGAVMNKLVGNVWANPISVVTGATVIEMCDDPGVLDIGRRMMTEFLGVCAALDIHPPRTVDQRLQDARKLGGFRTSMLQDMDRGRAIELEAILGVVIEIAEMLDRPADTLRTVYALVRRRAITEGCHAPVPGVD
jgi:2-dehydropantoate 2-reductase